MKDPRQLAPFYADQLREQILPFWLQHAGDEECGGYFSCLDRDGSVYEPHKVDILMQGRISWTFAWMYNEFEPRPEWLAFSRRGIGFVLKHGFDEKGRIYNALTRDGRPMLSPSIYHGELSTLIGMVEVARATKDDGLYRKARSLFEMAWAALNDPYGSPVRLGPPIRTHGNSMIVINVIQQLRACREEPEDRERIAQCIGIMRRCHYRPERRLLLEYTGWEGEDLDESLGRRVNPGHMIEGGIFLLHEHWRHPDAALREFGLNLIRWGFEQGWDREYGGLFNDIDAEGLPIFGMEGLLGDCKLWWQHAEALYGLLLGYWETRDPWYWNAYQQVHEYSFRVFPDPQYGEWYACLDRTGRPINRAKGTNRKCCYHIGRNFLWASKLAARF
ncbi:MAG TPA: AGE family epimerase/isomerase [Chthoniobacteraceae bacterium]|nr:AGE family epimerase/isomerase [Chthoniobacteraceae bacterium]